MLKFSQTELLDSLDPSKTDVHDLIGQAFQLRRQAWGKKVTIHIINNTQNGLCPEDCHYCAQSKISKAKIEKYRLKPTSEIMAEAKAAYERGAHRYCLVSSGRGPSTKRVNELADVIKTIKSTYNMEVCLSCGLISDDEAKTLADAGLDRFNHNLNTSESNYPKICTTHTYEDRLNSLKAARDAGIGLCSGIIVGMGESHQDIVDVAIKLNQLNAESIPVNFLVPVPGTPLSNPTPLTAEFCLRVLCLFRMTNPKAEIRIAGGREFHLKRVEALALYPANSLFLSGYLNVKGSPDYETLKLIQDMGFEIESDYELNQILEDLEPEKQMAFKKIEDLRPVLETVKT